MARMLDGMEQLLRGEVAPPPAAVRIGMRLATLGDGESYTTVEMKINFLRPAWTGRLEARGRVRNAGRTMGLVECDVVAEGDKVVAHAVSTCMRLAGEQAAGR